MARGRTAKPGQSGTQRQRRGESRDSSPEAERSGEGSGSENGNETGLEQREKLASDIVRLALFAEARRATFKRDDINKKVLNGARSRGFNAIFSRAQEILRDVFAMEIVEIPSRAEREAAEKALDDKDNDKGIAAGKKKQVAGAKVWMVRSTLDPQLIAAANAPDIEILNKERNRPQEALPALRDEFDDGGADSEGSILAWSTSDHLGSTGLLGVILSLILVNEKELPDKQLRSYLKNLRLTPETTVPFRTAHIGNKKVSLDDHLQNYIKLGYLEKLKDAVPGVTQGNKRGRGKAASSDPDAEYTWKWGGRALAEIGEAAVVEFMTSILVDGSFALDEDEEEAVVEEKREKESDIMRKSITKAAGGYLYEDSK